MMGCCQVWINSMKLYSAENLKFPGIMRCLQTNMFGMTWVSFRQRLLSTKCFRLWLHDAIFAVLHCFKLDLKHSLAFIKGVYFNFTLNAKTLIEKLRISSLPSSNVLLTMSNEIATTSNCEIWINIAKVNQA